MPKVIRHLNKWSSKRISIDFIMRLMRLNIWKATTMVTPISSRLSKDGTFSDSNLKLSTEMLIMSLTIAPRMTSLSEKSSPTKTNKPKSWETLWPRPSTRSQESTSDKVTNPKSSPMVIPSTMSDTVILESNWKGTAKLKCWSMSIHSKSFINLYRQLKLEGYRLKHKYKTETQPFAIVVNPGESTAIVLKRTK